MIQHVIAVILLSVEIRSETFTIGYLAGNKPREGMDNYESPGLRISGGLGLAVQQANAGLLCCGHKLEISVAETYGEEAESILQTAKLWQKNVSAIFGPVETCIHESLTSLLLEYNWKTVALFHPNLASREDISIVTETIYKTLQENGIKVKFRKSWNIGNYQHGFLEGNFFREWVRETADDVRIYIIYGHSDTHLGLLEALQLHGCLETNKYFVVGLLDGIWDRGDPGKYMRGVLESRHIRQETREAFNHYLAIMMSAPQPSYKNFTKQVKLQMRQPPFSGLLKDDLLLKSMHVRPEAAYLYDAVMLYVRAINKLLSAGRDPRDGKLVVDTLIGRSYMSAMGYNVHMDENGDAEGNYSLLYKQTLRTGGVGLAPIGRFYLNQTDSLRGLPFLRLDQNISWPTGSVPLDQPVCGFQGELCPSDDYCDIAIGVVGGLLAVILVVGGVAYRNWRYEQGICY